MISKPVQRPPEVVEPLLLLGHHRCRRAFDEAGVAELGRCLADLGLDARDLLGQPRAFGIDVDRHLQRQPGVALHGDRRAARGLGEGRVVGQLAHFGKPRQRLQQRRRRGDEFRIADHQQRHTLGR